jgi:hypothetical protein
MVQDSLLLPNSGVDLELVDQLNNFPRLLRGESEWAAKSSIDFAQAKAVLAMAHWQLGQKEIARSMLAKGDTLAPGIAPGSDADIGESWVAWLFARISFDEAAARVEPGSPTENNPAAPPPTR